MSDTASTPDATVVDPNTVPTPGAPLDPTVGTDVTDTPTIADPVVVGSGASDTVDPNAGLAPVPASVDDDGTLHDAQGNEVTIVNGTVVPVGSAAAVPDDTAAIAEAAANTPPAVGTPGVNVAPLDPAVQAEVDARVDSDVTADLAAETTSTLDDGTVVAGPTESVPSTDPAPSVTTDDSGTVVDAPVTTPAPVPATNIQVGTIVAAVFDATTGSIYLVASDGNITKGAVPSE